MTADLLLVVAEMDRRNSSDQRREVAGPLSSDRDASRQVDTGMLASPDTSGEDSSVPAQAEAVSANIGRPPSMISSCSPFSIPLSLVKMVLSHGLTRTNHPVHPKPTPL